ncbi:hypothetical protein [Methyloversatilis sp.]|uniref:hypothetical protein n=1 Tax=Methyloversatilis sp. TaxID=2569862 RepID=UPI002733139A|nr:hypothetical protein [Methyloversatilis sp.]MDP2868359.1 hypothetical protein [Methyloversatilis sp.]MDP3454192.1 hypothetical protein [Methyloversatilis sp.]MDP3578358.1 hypothetical protein [Methyloversatilis sp.]
MKYAKSTILLGASTILGGCAGLDFGEQGLSFFEPKPYLFVSVNKDCVSTATLISLPGDKKFVKFKTGYGSSDLSVALSNGILTNAGQKVDAKVPETITSIASLGTAIATLSAEKGVKQAICEPSAILYPVMNGVPDLKSPAVFPIQIKMVEGGVTK